LFEQVSSTPTAIKATPDVRANIRPKRARAVALQTICQRRSIQVDPSPTNARAIRCYEKAGFTRVGTVVTPDGPALLMRLHGPQADSVERKAER
jgi:hypothetical protein